MSEGPIKANPFYPVLEGACTWAVAFARAGCCPPDERIAFGLTDAAAAHHVQLLNAAYKAGRRAVLTIVRERELALVEAARRAVNGRRMWASDLVVALAAYDLPTPMPNSTRASSEK